MPTDDEIIDRVNSLIDEATAKELERYIEKKVPGLLQAIIDELVQLDLSPHEYGVLQDERVLLIRGFDRINRQGRYYYRDRPDKSTADNLMSLSPYKADRNT